MTPFEIAITFRPSDRQSAALRRLQEQDLDLAPVVDEAGIVGRISVETLDPREEASLLTPWNR